LNWGRRIRGEGMLYQAYQAHSDIMVPVRAFAGAALHAFGPLNGFSAPALKNLTAAYELIARAGLTHVRRPTPSRP
jgi:hypothetical protein